MNALATVSGLTVADAEGRLLLNGVDLGLSPGEIVGLVGASGAGKTTLAHILLGHLGPGLRIRCGEIRVAGADPFTPQGRRALRGRAAAFLSQDPAAALDPSRRIAAQLRTAARIAHPGQARRAREALIRGAAAAAALEPELLRRPPARLSGGQAQRALIAWALTVRPRLLVLDEPTSGLDEATALQVGSAFAALPWRPAVLLISHDSDLIGRICGRVLHLSAGRLREADAGPGAPRSHGPGVSRRPARGNAVVSMRGVTIRRGPRTLLADASLRLNAGELVALRGRSGSGKTSLARALCGLGVPRAGELRVHGKRIPWEARSRVRAGAPFLAYVGQDARNALNPRETAARTLARAVDSARRQSRVAPDPGTLLALSGLRRDILDRTPDRLSGGQRHRLALARALAAGPAALVCDETTAALDSGTAGQILDLLDGLRVTGLPILLITHQDHVAGRADRVLTLEKGRLA